MIKHLNVFEDHLTNKLLFLYKISLNSKIMKIYILLNILFKNIN